MLSLFLFSASTQTAEAQEIRIDMEAWRWGRRLDQYGDDEVGEDTKCVICAAEYKNGKYTTKCKKGLTNRTGSDFILMHHDFDKDADAIILQTDCDDNLWIDRLVACEYDSSFVWPWEFAYDCAGGPSKVWGKSDNAGLCLSTDRYDYIDWNTDDVPQYVYGAGCYTSLRFNKNGSVDGKFHPVLRRMDDSDDHEFTIDETDESEWTPLLGKAVHKIVVVDEYVSSPIVAPEDRRLENIKGRRLEKIVDRLADAEEILAQE